MQWRFLIWFFLLITSFFSSERGNSQELDSNLKFQNFAIGDSFEQVVQKLKSYGAMLNTYDPHIFSMQVPIYDFLASLKAHNVVVDHENQRIYYNKQVFFDLQNINLHNAIYDFSYKDPAYTLSVNAIKAYEVDYPSLVNNTLNSLSFKFYKNTLYAMEYKAQANATQIIRIKQKYATLYKENIIDGVNHFFTDEGSFFITINSPKTGNVDIIMMGKIEFSTINNYLNTVINRLVYDIVKVVNQELNVKENVSVMLLEERKEELTKKLRIRFGSIVEL